MSIEVFEYKKCSTCQKALRFLDAHEIKYRRIPIVDEPPSLAKLKKMLGFLKAQGGSIKNLFNTSGVQYRELGVAEKLKKGLSDDEALKMLSENGKLIKRPFLLTSDGGLVGFKEEQWKDLLL